MASAVDVRLKDRRLPTGPFGLARLTGMWFLGLTGIYLLYACSVFVGLGGDTPLLERVTMALGPSTFAFALLISPSLFASSIGQTDAPEMNPGRGLARYWALFALFAGVAFLLSTIGASIATSLTSPVPADSSEVFAGPRPSALEATRILMPCAISACVLLSGVAGILIGHITSGWRTLWRNTARWLFGMTLMASFLLPFLATTKAIAQHGTPPIWILLNPLAIPFLLTTLLVVRERHALGLSLGTRWRRARTQVDPEWLDRVVAQITGDPDSVVDPRGLTEPEREIAALAAAIRRIAGPRATLSESRVREIVAAITAASPARAPEAVKPRRSAFRPAVLGGFCTSWTCLAVGLVIVGPLGGVPTSVASAAIAGFLGSAGILLVARRCPHLAATVPT